MDHFYLNFANCHFEQVFFAICGSGYLSYVNIAHVCYSRQLVAVNNLFCKLLYPANFFCKFCNFSFWMKNVVPVIFSANYRYG